MRVRKSCLPLQGFLYHHNMVGKSYALRGAQPDHWHKLSHPAFSNKSKRIQNLFLDLKHGDSHIKLIQESSLIATLLGKGLRQIHCFSWIFKSIPDLIGIFIQEVAMSYKITS